MIRSLPEVSMSMRDLPSTERAAVPAVVTDEPVGASAGGQSAGQPVAVEPSSIEPSEPRAVPDATVERLATYLRVLTSLRDGGAQTISSAQLARAAGVNSALLRKDLSFLGSYGVRGVGYDVGTLTAQMQRVLGLTTDRSVALIGIGNLGQALAGYAGFASRGFHVAALLDDDPRRVGTTIHGHVVEHVSLLEQIVADRSISIAVLATPALVAQQVCDRIVAAGVTSILNFAPIVVSVPDHVDLRKVDLAAELQILSFHESRKDVASLSRGLSGGAR